METPSIGRTGYVSPIIVKIDGEDHLVMIISIPSMEPSAGGTGWYEFRRQLACKLEWRGGRLVEVDARYTSQRCSYCGYTDNDHRRSQAAFEC